MRVEPNAPLTSGFFGRTRHEALDSARLLATLGVIWTHVTEVQGQSYGSSALGRFGTSYYILLAIFFSVRSRIARPFEPMSLVIKTRMRRLMVPFLLWSVVYALLYIRYGLSIHSSFQEIALWWGPLAGTARHLWFLPFAAFAGIVASLVTPRLMAMTVPVLCTLFVLGSVFWYWLFDGVIFFALDRPWELSLHLHRMDRWIEEIPLLLSGTVGVVLFQRLGAQADARVPSVPKPVYATLAFAAWVLMEWFYYSFAGALRLVSGGETRMVAHGAGALLFGAALLATEVRWIRWIARFSRHTYFVFLAHVVVLDGLSTPFSKTPGFGTVWFSVLCTLGIYASCSLVGRLVRRVPGLRAFYPGS